MRIPEIVLVGPAEDISGPGEAMRNIFEALYNMGLKVKVVSTEDQSKPKLTLPRDLHDKLAGAILREDVQPMTAVHIVSERTPVLSVNDCPLQVSYTLGGTEKCSDLTQFKLVNNNFKENWVSSKYLEAGWKVPSSQIGESVRLMPLGVDTLRFSPSVEPLNIEQVTRARELGDPVVFLMSEEFSKIKNPEAVVSAFLKEFKDNSDAYLVIKFINDPKDQSRMAIRQRVTNERMLLQSTANVLLLSEYLDYDLIPSLFRAATFYVTMSRLEGWPTGSLQSLATGVPVIAPNSYGYSEILDPSYSYLVKTTDGVINDKTLLVSSPGVNGQTWKDPNPGSITAKMRQAYVEYKSDRDLYNKKSVLAREAALRYSLPNLAGRIVIHLGKYFN